MPPTVALEPVQPTDGDGRVGAGLSHIGEAAQPTICPDQGRLDDGSVSVIQHCTSEAASPLSTIADPRGSEIKIFGAPAQTGKE